MGPAPAYGDALRYVAATVADRDGPVDVRAQARYPEWIADRDRQLELFLFCLLLFDGWLVVWSTLFAEDPDESSG